MSDKNLRIYEEDHKWLKNHRGSESMKALVNKVIMKYKEVEASAQPKSTSPHSAAAKVRGMIEHIVKDA